MTGPGTPEHPANILILILTLILILILILTLILILNLILITATKERKFNIKTYLLMFFELSFIK